MFWYDRYKAVIEAALNLIISIVLVMHLGVVGVFIGTFCSTMLTSVWVEPYILYKYRFEMPPSCFFAKYVKTMLVMTAVWGCTYYCGNLIQGLAILNFVYRLVICAVVPNILLLVVYCRSEEWEYVLQLIKKILKKGIEKITGNMETR